VSSQEALDLMQQSFAKQLEEVTTERTALRQQIVVQQNEATLLAEQLRTACDDARDKLQAAEQELTSKTKQATQCDAELSRVQTALQLANTTQDELETLVRTSGEESDALVTKCQALTAANQALKRDLEESAYQHTAELANVQAALERVEAVLLQERREWTKEHAHIQSQLDASAGESTAIGVQHKAELAKLQLLVDAAQQQQQEDTRLMREQARSVADKNELLTSELAVLRGASQDSKAQLSRAQQGLRAANQLVQKQAQDIGTCSSVCCLQMSSAIAECNAAVDAAASAAVILQVSCRGLVKTKWLSKSSPVVMLSIAAAPSAAESKVSVDYNLVSQTEIVRHNHEPTFAQRLRVHAHAPGTMLRFAVHDVEAEAFSDSNLIGMAECRLADLLGKNETATELVLRHPFGAAMSRRIKKNNSRIVLSRCVDDKTLPVHDDDDDVKDALPVFAAPVAAEEAAAADSEDDELPSPVEFSENDGGAELALENASQRHLAALYAQARRVEGLASVLRQRNQTILALRLANEQLVATKNAVAGAGTLASNILTDEDEASSSSVLLQDDDELLLEHPTAGLVSATIESPRTGELWQRVSGLRRHVAELEDEKAAHVKAMELRDERATMNQETVQSLRDELKALTTTSNLQEEMRLQLAACKSQLAICKQQNQELKRLALDHRGATELKRALNEARRKQADAEAVSKKQIEHLKRLQGMLQQSDDALSTTSVAAELEAKLATAVQHLTEKHMQLEISQDHAKQQQQELNEARQAVAASEEQVAIMKVEIASLSNDHRTTQRNCTDKCAPMREAQRAQIAQLEATLAEQAEHLAQLQVNDETNLLVADLKHRVGAAEDHTKRQQLVIEQQHAELDTSRTRHEALKQQLALARQELEASEARGAAAAAERSTATERKGATAAEAVATSNTTAALSTDVDDLLIDDLDLSLSIDDVDDEDAASWI
jgi:hypothetical protein